LKISENVHKTRRKILNCVIYLDILWEIKAMSTLMWTLTLSSGDCNVTIFQVTVSCLFKKGGHASNSFLWILEFGEVSLPIQLILQD
jgi:hypothetical protein